MFYRIVEQIYGLTECLRSIFKLYGEKIMKCFSWRAKLVLLCVNNKVPKTTIPSSLCVLNQISSLPQKPALDHYVGEKSKNGDKNNVFRWES